MSTLEYNFDGLIGPTHNFGGLSRGNLASSANRFAVSHPKKAALQGLRKMKLLLDWGIPQGFLPPQERPDILFLRKQGFTGNDRQVLEKAAAFQDQLLINYSASSMWVANAATVSPSADTQDHRVHITAANLVTQKHRTIEPAQTARLLKLIFPEQRHFVHHPPLPDEGTLFDEGAANGFRLAGHHGHKGIEVFVYGKIAENDKGNHPLKYPARQSLEASKIIGLTHQLSDDQIVFAQQNPQVIDAGVFHNDLVVMSNENLLIYHERAFLDGERVEEEIRRKYEKLFRRPLHVFKVTDQELKVEDAVLNYFFNSQLVTLPDKSMAVICSRECDEPQMLSYADYLVSGDNPIRQVVYVDLNESMANGGGPACLRLRVVLTESEQATVNPNFILTEDLYSRLEHWILKHFRDDISIDDLKDPELLDESRQTLDALTQILKTGPIYPFQL